MGFLGSLFRKDFKALKAKADRHLERREWAHAREAYQDALAAGKDVPEGDREEAEARLAQASDALARLNMEEARQALSLDQVEEALDNLDRAMELAASPEVRDEAALMRQQALAGLDDEAAVALAMGRPGYNIGGDEGASPQDEDDQFPLEERFEALLLPMDAERAEAYRALPAPFPHALVRLNEGHTDQALALLETLRADHPDSAVLALEVGRAKLFAGQHQEAADLFREAHEGGMLNTEGRYLMAEALWELKAFDEAEDLLREALDDEESLQTTLARIAETHILKGTPQEALPELEEAAQAFSNSVLIWRTVGRLREMGGDERGAIEAFETVMKLHWRYDIDQGVLEFDRESGIHLAQLYIKRSERLARALDLLGALATTTAPSRRWSILRSIGEVNLRLKDMAEAQKSFSLALDILERPDVVVGDVGKERRELGELLVKTKL